MIKVSVEDLERIKPLICYNMIFDPDANFKTILLRDLIYTPDNVEKILRVVKSCGGKLRLMPPSNPLGQMVDMAVIFECPNGVEEIIGRKIEELGVCREVQIIKSLDRRVAINPFFPIICNGRRAVIMPEILYGSLFEGMRTRFKPALTQIFLYQLGIRAGAELAQLLMGILKDYRDDIVNALRILFHFGRAFGYNILGNMKILDEREIILEVIDGWEAKALKKRYTSPQCHLTRGLIEGFLSKVIGGEWNVEEMECAAMGFERCKFIIRRKAE